ncbi:hypothetical protein A3I45_03310 [Candidatus Uhrbacteria bacterium RIFCSPLOWO2_02_FULL_53_10]|uniref:Uncharacterized protein n=1 Tax=Candidatus Uhrbacteria bacterium RIFCSPLOWO2_02_FULL_53_10 TaxID=1802411 RepID=A0A1F7VEI1_9BACT|nr:MAG: hypothetical protein A3I45_03310 [Candidatus Uhrbacteria bacterium RIFCSPLOWO2_02_FULL_53_10]
MEWKFAERSNVAKLWPSKSERQLTILELSRFEEEDGAWLKAIKDIVAKGGWVLLLPELFSGTEFVLSQGQTPESTEVMHGFVQTGIFGLNPNAPNEEPLTFLGPDDNPYNSGDVHAAVALRYGLVLIVPEIDYKNLEESPRYDTGRFIG